MLDHVTLHVQDLQRALSFYRAALAPINYTVAMEFPSAAGLGEAVSSWARSGETMRSVASDMARDKERVFMRAILSRRGAPSSSRRDSSPDAQRLQLSGGFLSPTDHHTLRFDAI